MSFKPWKQPLLAALAMMAGTTAATAQNIQTAQRDIEVGRYNAARAALTTANNGQEPYTDMHTLVNLLMTLRNGAPV